MMMHYETPICRLTAEHTHFMFNQIIISRSTLGSVRGWASREACALLTIHRLMALWKNSMGQYRGMFCIQYVHEFELFIE